MPAILVSAERERVAGNAVLREVRHVFQPYCGTSEAAIVKKSGAFLVGIEGIADSSSRGPEAVGMNVQVMLVGRWEGVGLGARQVK